MSRAVLNKALSTDYQALTMFLKRIVFVILEKEAPERQLRWVVPMLIELRYKHCTT
jgi:hypothetical protein